MVTVHGIGLSMFVRKVRIFLTEKKIPYTLDPVFPLDPPANFKRISPLGKIPAITDGDFTLADSGVICAYYEKLNPNPSLYPEAPKDYAKAIWIEKFCDTALVAVIGGKMFFPKIVGPKFLNTPTDQALVDEGEQEMVSLLVHLESQLQDNGLFVGDTFSIADIAVIAHMINYLHAGYTVDSDANPKLAQFVQTQLKRASVSELYAEDQKALGN